jgi:hypothetical protein
MMGMTADVARRFHIFFPAAASRYMTILQNKTRFVQYTRAESAIKILRSKALWMRKAQWMNDYREIEYGWELLYDVYRNTQAGQRFRAALDAAHSGISKEITDNFDPWVNSYRLNTYVASLSEHDDSEDTNGRLSMWRAYGGSSGVAMVIKSAPLTTASHELGAYSSPVTYFSRPDVEAHFDKIAAAVQGDTAFVASQPRPAIVSMIHEALRFGIICCKHPGFDEEREWRIVYNPERDEHQYKKLVLTRSVEVVNGIAQPVYSMPLKVFPGYDLSPAAILDRIIIGPTNFPDALLEAFRIELEGAGVPNPKDKVIVSDIPLRS